MRYGSSRVYKFIILVVVIAAAACAGMWIKKGYKKDGKKESAEEKDGEKHSTAQKSDDSAGSAEEKDSADSVRTTKTDTTEYFNHRSDSMDKYETDPGFYDSIHEEMDSGNGAQSTHKEEESVSTHATTVHFGETFGTGHRLPNKTPLDDNMNDSNFEDRNLSNSFAVQKLDKKIEEEKLSKRLQEEELNKRLEENELNKRLEENELNKRLEKEELKKKSEKNKIKTRAERDALNKKLEEDKIKKEALKKKLKEDEIKKRLEEVRANKKIEENNTYNSLSGAEQVVKDKLCEIVHLYDGICKNIGADKTEWFMKHVGFIKTVTECLDRPVLFFENKPTSLSEIIDHLFYPEDRVAYPWDAINVHSVRLDIPPELRKSDDLLNILFTYVKKKIFPLTYITICNSAPSSNFKFTEFDCFTRVREVTLIDVSLHSNTFKDMEKITKISEITFKGKTKLVGDTSVKIDIDSLESLVISGLDVAEIKHFLSALDIESREYSSFRLSIEKISLVDTQIISSLSYLPSLACLSLNDIVFKGVPDFTFIKRIKSLHTLRMLNIFYGYNEKYEESSFENIRKNVNYLNISQVQNESKYSEYTEEEKSIIAENKKIGSEISLSYFSSNNNIYSDLGISKVKLREFTSIHVAFPLLKGRTVYDALIYDMNFSLNLKEKSLTIMANMPFEENEILTGITNSLDCPFSSCDEIKNIKISITNKSYLSDKFVHTLISLLFLYPDSNPIETITILSKETASVHIEKLIECGKRFKTLKRIEFINSRPYKNGSPIVKDDTIEEVKDTLDYKIDMIAKVEKESYSYRTIITFSREAQSV